MIHAISVADVPPMETAHDATARKLYASQHVQAVHIELQPGQSLRPHITPVDVLFFVLDGRGIVEIGDERQSVAAGTMVESPKNIRHRWVNESDSVFRVLVIKTPAPTEASQIL
jgi:quercetin dioxygenase-like cupin family protein